MKSTRGSKLDRPTTTILQSDLGFHLTPGSPLFEEKKSSNAGVKHAVGVSFERTEAVSRALSRTREREREILSSHPRDDLEGGGFHGHLVSLLYYQAWTLRSVSVASDTEPIETTDPRLPTRSPTQSRGTVGRPFFLLRPPSTTRDYRPPHSGQLVPDPFVSESLLRPRNASCAQTGDCSSRNSSRILERSEPREPVTRTRRYVHREDGKARGMAPVEREISNLVMDKRLLESQFFVLCWHKSSFLLSLHLCFFKIRAWIRWNWINKFSFLSGGFRNMYFNEQVIRDNFVFGWTRGCC